MKKELAKFMANQLIGPAYVVDNAKVNEDGSVMTFSAHGKKNTNVKITGVVKEPQQELPLEDDDEEDDGDAKGKVN